jgi:hypothetical protein
MPMMAKIVQTAKQTVKAIVLAASAFRCCLLSTSGGAGIPIFPSRRDDPFLISPTEIATNPGRLFDLDQTTLQKPDA